MRKLFGTDGVRGVANLDPMTSEIAMQLGRAAAHLFMRRADTNETADSQQTIVTYFAPPGADLRIDEPSPGNCPF